MKIEGPNPLRKNEPVKKKGAAGAAAPTDFFSLISPEAAGAAASGQPITDIQPPTSLDALLTLQEIPDEERREREAFQHSNVTVDTLEKLRRALLDGAVPSHLLSEMHEVVRQQQSQVRDPRLRAIMQDIELRVAVEIAKLERAQSAGRP